MDSDARVGRHGTNESRHRADWVVPWALLVAALLALLRQEGASSWTTIWAEDGWVYFQQAHDDGLGAVFRGFAGYLQLPTRLFALPAPLLPIDGLGLYLSIVAASVTAMLAWFMYWATGGWIADRPARFALAALTALMPALGLEGTANITNLIWLFLAAAPWAFLARSRTPRAVLLRSTVAFAAASASPIALVVLPVAAFVVSTRRDRASWTVAGAYCLGLAVQALVAMNTEDDRLLFPVRDAGDLPEIVGVRVFSQYLLGDRGIEALWDLQWLVVAGMPILALAALAFLGASTWRACTERVVAAAGLTLLAVALLVVPVWGRGTNHGAIEFPQETILGPVPQAGEYNPGPSHFSIAPVLVLGGALAVLVSADHRSRRARQLLGAAFVAHLVVVGAFGFRVTNGRSAGPEWLPTVETARKGCEGRPPNEVAELALPQPFFNPPIRVTCDELTG